MAEAVTILLAFISILVSLIAGILSYMLYHFIPMKQKVNTLWNSWFGVPGTDDTGKLEEMRMAQEDIRDEHTDMRQLVESTKTDQREAHEEVKSSFRDVFQYLNQLALELRREGVEVTKPDEEIDEDDFYRGGSGGDD